MIGRLDRPELFLLWGFNRTILKTTNYGKKCGSKTIYMLLNEWFIESQDIMNEIIFSDKPIICGCIIQYDLNLEEKIKKLIQRQ